MGLDRRLLLAAAASAAGYGLYRLYLHQRSRVVAVLSLADAVSLVASDLADFLRSDSDHLPRSLLQLSKLAASQPISSAASSLSESLASGLLRALSQSQSQSHSHSHSQSQTDRILDRLLSPAGTGFASALVATFARNVVLSYHTTHRARAHDHPDWLCSDRGKDAAADLVRVFVSTAVAAYLDRTATVRGKSEQTVDPKLKDLVVSACNGAVETFVRTRRQASAPPNSNRCRCSGDGVMETLAVPSNRRFVLDVTGRVTAETVRSFLEFLSDGARKGIATARSDMGAKSMAIFTICLALCMHISVGTRFLLLPA
ncbi:protein PHLOEM PROTEIN 2-LIKE A10-like [Oryza brachyantha]|uniref:Protein PHLOEM PROTEIN 2-LIKE A10 n=1 Tax=Oryza brachyantha TaxID=4533 RepID=J3N0G7_ORYBR|nr:protein PHLOEM PROTEIN 2-LIKE A10-like [Oryza brachyantha]